MLAAFEDSLAGKSPHTAKSYRTAVDRFFEYLQERGIDPAETATTALPADALERYYIWLVRRYGRVSRGTHVTYVAGVRAFYRYLERQDLTPPGVTMERLKAGLREVMGRAPSYKTPRIDQRLPEIVTHVDSVSLPGGGGERAKRRRLELLRDRALLRTLYCTAMRRAEVGSLNRTDVQDGHADQALITGKGEKERVVFFDDDTLAAIRAYLRARDDRYLPLFIRHDTGRGKPGLNGANYRITTQTIWNVVKRYAKAVGVNVSPHDFRHDKASVMLNQGAKLSEVQDILGHASPETTKKIYAHYETAHLRDAFDRYSVPAEARVKRSKRAGDQ
ncbi:MAG: tyrosine-type recombinase/integrase [Chloroflexi bacterium]|nr:tyrosine-type recombinase/integrase [Chloroflexota bacterium]